MSDMKKKKTGRTKMIEVNFHPKNQKLIEKNDAQVQPIWVSLKIKMKDF